MIELGYCSIFIYLWTKIYLGSYHFVNKDLDHDTLLPYL
jgi:hypothetical protein